jgi:predicted lipid-binding transport protein (Tim44 family)
MLVELIIGLSTGVYEELIGVLHYGLIGILHHGLSGGLSGGLFCGGNAVIQHIIIRLILYQNGGIPWNYARFLDHAVQHRFIQRVGGRYRFMHDLLRKHFAQMPLN